MSPLNTPLAVPLTTLSTSSAKRGCRTFVPEKDRTGTPLVPQNIVSATLLRSAGAVFLRHSNIRCRCLSWVKSGKSQSEQKFSALHQKAVTYARASSTGGGKAGGVVVSLRRAKRSSSDRMAAWSATRARIRRSLLRLSRMAEAALRIGSCGQWIALPARCGRAPPLLTTCRRAALPQSAG